MDWIWWVVGGWALGIVTAIGLVAMVLRWIDAPYSGPERLL